jgi:hypothetical protein
MKNIIEIVDHDSCDKYMDQIKGQSRYYIWLPVWRQIWNEIDVLVRNQVCNQISNQILEVEL